MLTETVYCYQKLLTDPSTRLLPLDLDPDPDPGYTVSSVTC